VSFEITLHGAKETRRLTERVYKAAKDIRINAPNILTENLARYMYLEAPSWSGHLKRQIWAVKERTGSARVETRTYQQHKDLHGRKSNKSYAEAVETGYIPKPPWPQYRSAKYGDFATRALNRLEKHYKDELDEPIDKAMR